MAFPRDVGYDVPTSWHGLVCLILCLCVRALYHIKESTSSYLADQA